MLRRIDQVRCTQRRPPRRPHVVSVRLTIAEWKRRRGDAADDQHDGRGAELGPLHPASQLNVLELAAYDLDRQVLDDEAPRPQVGGG